MMSRNYKVSVIVPVYNVEKYLEKCVKTIIGNSYKNLEIILVDDGSTDSSGSICNRYAKLYDNIVVIHQKNKGLSSARNVGCRKATGEYILFVDSDDYIDKFAIEKLVKAALDYNADLVQGGLSRVNERYLFISTPKCTFEVLDTEKKIRDAYFITGKLMVTAWGKLYKRDVIKSITMVEGYNNEDVMYMSDIIPLLRKVVVLPDVLYYYLQRTDSIMGSKISKKKFDSFYAYEYALSRYNLNMPEYSIFIKRLICMNCFYLYDLAKKEKAPEEDFKVINDYFNKYKLEVFDSFVSIPVNKKMKIRLKLFAFNKNLAIKLNKYISFMIKSYS